MIENTTPLTDAIKQVVPLPVPRLAKKLGRKRPVEPPVHQDPIQELRRLVRMHKRWVQTAQQWEASISDYKLRATGETLRCTVPEHVRADVRNCIGALRGEADAIVRQMGKLLRGIPLYDLFLSKVFGFGPIVSSYLITRVNPRRCTKVSQLVRYCGNANDPATGKREIRHGAPKYGPDGTYDASATGTYNDELKMRLWQAMSAMYKCAAKAKVTTKYLDRWVNVVHSRTTTERAKGAFHAGRRKATDLFLWDLYVMARTLAGLEVWPDKHAAETGFFHGGIPVWGAPRTLSIDEALAMVGDPGKHPGALPVASDEDLTEGEAAE
jgi:hypothetical protein